eukprot:gene33202-42936_t
MEAVKNDIKETKEEIAAAKRRLQNCYRAKLFQITEQFIGFRTSDSAVRNQCGRRGDIDNPYEISIGNEIVSRVYAYQNLARIFDTDYIHVDNDDDTNNSPLCDEDGDSLSIYNKALSSKGEKEDKDPNNHLFMSRQMHQHLDGIETNPKNTPSFLIRYLSHEEALVDCSMWDNVQYIMNPAVLRQRVIVEIVFRDKSFCDHFRVILRNGSIRTGDRVVQMDLYFEDARKARTSILI